MIIVPGVLILWLLILKVLGIKFKIWYPGIVIFVVQLYWV